MSEHVVQIRLDHRCHDVAADLGSQFVLVAAFADFDHRFDFFFDPCLENVCNLHGYTDSKETPKKKPATKKTATKKKRAAKKAPVNKSQAIRVYLKTHKNAGPKEVQAALAKKGIRVTDALVSNVKSSAKKKKAAATKARVAEKPAEHTPLQDMKEAGNLMVKAVELVISAGATEAKQLISTASEIVKKAQGKD